MCAHAGLGACYSPGWLLQRHTQTRKPHTSLRISAEACTSCRQHQVGERELQQCMDSDNGRPTTSPRTPQVVPGMGGAGHLQQRSCPKLADSGAPSGRTSVRQAHPCRQGSSSGAGPWQSGSRTWAPWSAERAPQRAGHAPLCVQLQPAFCPPTRYTAADAPMRGTRRNQGMISRLPL